MEGTRLLLGDWRVNQLRGGCFYQRQKSAGRTKERRACGRERWRDGGERNRPDKSGTKDKGKRREQNRNQKTMRRKEREEGLGSLTGRAGCSQADY